MVCFSSSHADEAVPRGRLHSMAPSGFKGAQEERVLELEAALAQVREKLERDSEMAARAVSRAKMHAADLSEELEAASAAAEEKAATIDALEVGLPRHSMSIRTLD